MSLSPEMLEYHRQWREAHKESKRKSQRNWSVRNVDKLRQYNNAWKSRNRHLCNEWRKQHPEPTRANALISGLIKVGKLNRATHCSKCGAEAKTQGHHPDYSKPLEVIWLCYSCHLAEHGKASRK